MRRGGERGGVPVPLRYPHTQEPPGAEDGGEGLAAGEMAKAADHFQAGSCHALRSSSGAAGGERGGAAGRRTT